MPEWEYKIEMIQIDRIDDRNESEESLNELGEQGWELTGWTREDDGHYMICILKREKIIDPSKRKD